MIISRLVSNAQTTLPRSVIEALRLKEGDAIAYRLEGDRVVITNASTAPEDPFATFEEWAGEADSKAYGSL